MSVKNEILNILIAAEGEYISGQDLGEQLFCSRNAVWKAIQSLRQDGYLIEAVTNKGYATEREPFITTRETRPMTENGSMAC